MGLYWRTSLRPSSVHVYFGKGEIDVAADWWRIYRIPIGCNNSRRSLTTNTKLSYVLEHRTITSHRDFTQLYCICRNHEFSRPFYGKFSKSSIQHSRLANACHTRSVTYLTLIYLQYRLNYPSIQNNSKSQLHLSIQLRRVSWAKNFKTQLCNPGSPRTFDETTFVVDAAWTANTKARSIGDGYCPFTQYNVWSRNPEKVSKSMVDIFETIQGRNMATVSAIEFWRWTIEGLSWNLVGNFSAYITPSTPISACWIKRANNEHRMLSVSRIVGVLLENTIRQL